MLSTIYYYITNSQTNQTDSRISFCMRYEAFMRYFTGIAVGHDGSQFSNRFDINGNQTELQHWKTFSHRLRTVLQLTNTWYLMLYLKQVLSMHACKSRHIVASINIIQIAAS